MPREKKGLEHRKESAVVRFLCECLSSEEVAGKEKLLRSSGVHVPTHWKIDFDQVEAQTKEQNYLQIGKI